MHQLAAAASGAPRTHCFSDPTSIGPACRIAREPADCRGGNRGSGAPRRRLWSEFHASSVFWLSISVCGLPHRIRHFRIIAALDQPGAHRGPGLPRPRIHSVAYFNTGITAGAEGFDPDAVWR